MSDPTTKMIVLKSSDDKIIEVEKSIAEQSQTLKLLIEDDCADSTIPVNNINGSTLTKIMNYCKVHADTTQDSESLKNFDKEFVDVGQAVLYELLMAANFLNVKSLLQLICRTVADKIKGRTPQEIREFFEIENDFTEEEEETIRKENAWAFG